MGQNSGKAKQNRVRKSLLVGMFDISPVQTFSDPAEWVDDSVLSNQRCGQVLHRRHKLARGGRHAVGTLTYWDTTARRRWNAISARRFAVAKRVTKRESAMALK